MEVSKQNTKYLKERLLKINETFKSEQCLEQEESQLVDIGTTFELLLGDEWWEKARRLASGCIMDGTIFRVKYECVSKNPNLRTDRGKCRLLFKYLVDSHMLSTVSKTFTGF